MLSHSELSTPATVRHISFIATAKRGPADVLHRQIEVRMQGSMLPESIPEIAETSIADHEDRARLPGDTE